MKIFIVMSTMLIASLAHARPHTLIKCSPLDGSGLKATFVYDGFDDKYSHVTVFNKTKKLFSMNGDTRLNPCLEVDMSAGSDTVEGMSDIIAVFSVYEMSGCQGPFDSARLGVVGKHGAVIMKGNLAVRHNGNSLEERVKCSVKDVQ